MNRIISFLKRAWSWLVMAILALVVISLLIGRGAKSPQSVELPPLNFEQPQRTAPTPQGTVTFCFRLDGRENGHLPALMGSAAGDVYPNGLDGYNWSLAPVSTGQEAYGILTDGTIFAKEDFLRQYGMSSYVELKADRTGWQAVAMSRGMVNGEAAYVY